jgi:hypothetical protein
MVFRGACRKKVSAKEIAVAILDNAFERTKMPLIIMLEMHTSDEQTATFARVIRATFGEAILLPDETDLKTAPLESLAGKIIIAHKTHVGARDVYKGIEGAPDLQKVVEKLNAAGRRVDTTIGAAELVALSAMKICSTEEDLIYTIAEEERQPARIWIVSDNDAKEQIDALRRRGCDMRQRGCDMIVRVYPSTEKHADSSNCYPSQYLTEGSSMVSMNYQSYDQPMRIADAIFARNGGIGFVLKPAHLRDTSIPAPLPKTYMLSVQVLVGQQIPHPDKIVDANNEIIDPYVVVRLGGVAVDMEDNPPLQTKVIYDNGFNPEWNQTFRFIITDIAVASLSLCVMTKNRPLDREIGEAVIHLTMLRLGYRAVPLVSCIDGAALPAAMLLCHFALEERG